MLGCLVVMDEKMFYSRGFGLYLYLSLAFIVNILPVSERFGTHSHIHNTKHCTWIAVEANSHLVTYRKFSNIILHLVCQLRTIS